MLWVEYVCLIPVKENFENVFETHVIALELPMKGLITGIRKQNTKKKISFQTSNFEVSANFVKFLMNRCYSLELPVYVI